MRHTNWSLSTGSRRGALVQKQYLKKDKIIFQVEASTSTKKLGWYAFFCQIVRIVEVLFLCKRADVPSQKMIWPLIKYCFCTTRRQRLVRGVPNFFYALRSSSTSDKVDIINLLFIELSSPAVIENHQWEHSCFVSFHFPLPVMQLQGGTKPQMHMPLQGLSNSPPQIARVSTNAPACANKE